MENRELTPAPGDVTAEMRMPGAGVGAGIGLAVLSQDDRVIDTVEEVVTADHAISVCLGEAELAELVIGGKCGVALIDAPAVPGSLEELTARLRQQFPDLVLIVAGGAEHQSVLAAQIAAGTVYRFLHKPVSAQRVRLFVDAALRRHDEEHAMALERQRATAVTARNRVLTGASTPGGIAPRTLAIGAAAVVLLGAAMWLGTRGGKDDKTPSAGSIPAAPGAAAQSTLSPELATLLAAADRALAQGDIVTPAGKSAADLYRQVIAKVPGQPRAVAGLDSVVNTLLSLSEQAILADRLDAAAAPLEAARALMPENVRIAFLQAQLGKERERAALATAADTAGALERRQLEQRVRENLRLAQDRLQRSAITEPAGDNTRFYIESARALSPRDPGVGRLTEQMNQRVLTEARSAIGRSDAPAANRWLRVASDLGIPASETDALRAQLTTSQGNTRTNEVARLATLVSQRIAQGRLIEPASDSAKTYFTALQDADTGGQSAQTLRAPLVQALLNEARGAVQRGNATAAQRWIDEAAAVGATAQDLTEARGLVTALPARGGAGASAAAGPAAGTNPGTRA